LKFPPVGAQIRKTKEYRQLKRVLSASIYAMSGATDASATNQLTGPIE
jgi:hypothetical protein